MAPPSIMIQFCYPPSASVTAAQVEENLTVKCGPQCLVETGSILFLICEVISCFLVTPFIIFKSTLHLFHRWDIFFLLGYKLYIQVSCSLLCFCIPKVSFFYCVLWSLFFRLSLSSNDQRLLTITMDDPGMSKLDYWREPPVLIFGIIAFFKIRILQSHAGASKP